MNNRVKIAKEFAKKIMNDHIKQIVLFGSVARGEDDENSDINILIITDDEELIEDEISDEVMDILLYQEEHVSAHIITEEHITKLKISPF